MTDRPTATPPRWTILLPTHNRADVLPFAIRSVLAQSVQNFELLIAADGCTDSTAALVASFPDPRIRFFNLPKAPGFGYANRNLALRQSRGTFIAYMTHDDLWFPDHLARLDAALSGPIEWAYSRPLWVIPPGRLAPGTFNLESPATLHAFLAKQQNALPSCCVAHRRSCFEKYGYWNEQLEREADRDLWSRIIEGGHRQNFAYLPEPTTLHFRANWRTDPSHIVENERVWDHFHNLPNWMPQPLTIPIPPGLTEQQALWQAMSPGPDPQTWPRQIRQAVQQALDQRLTQNDTLIATLLHHPNFTLPNLLNNFDRVSLAFRPPWLLRKLIGLNNRLRRLRNR